MRPVACAALAALTFACGTPTVPRDAQTDAPRDAASPDAHRDGALDASSSSDALDAAGDSRDAPVDTPNDTPPTDTGAALRCLPARRADLVALLDALPFAPRTGGAAMTPVPRASDAWAAARDAARAWAAADCRAFATAAARMGYDAAEVTDTATGHRHWVLSEPAAAGARYNGVFAFRAPDERDRARPLVVDSPHRGYDFSDQRALELYRRAAGVAFLQNTAHRCNLAACSGCSSFTTYACGGCSRASDVVHSADQLYYAVYDGLEAARDDLHLEYHGAGEDANAAGCAGTAHVSQGSTRALDAATDEGTYPNRFWRALSRRLGDGCVCYHQRESGCTLSGSLSIAGRRTNAEALAETIDACTTAARGLSARFVHLEGYRVGVDDVIAAMSEAVPLP